MDTECRQYSQAVRLRDALTKVGVPNQLLTIPGKKRGGFKKDEMTKIRAAIKEFLKKNKILD